MNESPGLQLPPPVGEQEPLMSNIAEVGATVPEQSPAAAEQAPSVAQSAPAAAPAVPLSAATTPVPPLMPPIDVSTTTTPATTTAADDSDLIEKEWVTKAKQIVERTKDNPYQQSEELTVFKADYMKKRYDKTIKVSK